MTIFVYLIAYYHLFQYYCIYTMDTDKKKKIGMGYVSEAEVSDATTVHGIIMELSPIRISQR